MITTDVILKLYEADKISLSKAMIDALQKNTGITFTRTCSKCGFLINQYKGAYPKTCSVCGGDIVKTEPTTESYVMFDEDKSIGIIKIDESIINEETYVTKIYTKLSLDSWVIYNGDTFEIFDIKKPSKNAPNTEKYLDQVDNIKVKSVSSIRLDDFLDSLIALKKGQNILNDKTVQKKLKISKLVTGSKDDYLEIVSKNFKDKYIFNESSDKIQEIT